MKRVYLGRAVSGGAARLLKTAVLKEAFEEKKKKEQEVID